MAGSFDSFMNVAVPVILIIIAAGFTYTKFLKPWVVPHIQEWLEGRNEKQQLKVKEISYE